MRKIRLLSTSTPKKKQKIENLINNIPNIDEQKENDVGYYILI